MIFSFFNNALLLTKLLLTKLSLRPEMVINKKNTILLHGDIAACKSRWDTLCMSTHTRGTSWILKSYYIDDTMRHDHFIIRIGYDRQMSNRNY